VREKDAPGPDPVPDVPLLEGGAEADLAEGGGGLCVTVGVILRKDLNPTFASTIHFFSCKHA
jgi:hypothetical protein